MGSRGHDCVRRTNLSKGQVGREGQCRYSESREANHIDEQTKDPYENKSRMVLTICRRIESGTER